MIVGGVRFDSAENHFNNQHSLLFDVKNNVIFKGIIEPFPSIGFIAHTDMGGNKIIFNGGVGFTRFTSVRKTTYILEMNTMSFTTKPSCPKNFLATKTLLTP